MIILNKISILLLLSGTLVLILFSGCADQSQWAKKVEWFDIDPGQIPTQEDLPEEGAVILLDEGKIEIFSSGPTGFSVFERHKIIKIFNLKGERFANVMLPYYPRVTIESIQARTISPSGKITIIDEEDIFDVNLYPGFIFYSDQRAKIFTMPAIEPGSIVEYRYKVNITGRTLWHSWIFQDEIPTLVSRFTIIHPAEWKLKFRQYHLDIEPDAVIAPQGFKSSRTWESRNIPAIISEYGMPPRKDLVSRLSFAPVGVNSWEDVARWYDGLAAPQTELNDDLKNLSQKLTAGATSDTEKLKRIYEWVRDNVRYIAVEIGIGGYQPHPAKEVLNNQYGDCKDMTTLLCALAKASNIRVDEVLISTRPNGMPDTTLASPFQFNHAIAYSPVIGAKGIWMDATQKGTPFGKLPWYNQGLPVLLVGADGRGELKTTPQYPADSNRVETRWRINLLEDGSAKIDGETNFRGAMAEEIREEFFYATHNVQRQWLEIYLARRCAGVELDTFHISGLQPVIDPMTISYRFQASGFARARPNQLSIQPAEIYQFELPSMFRRMHRTHPIQFRFPLLRQIELTISLPQNCQPEISFFRDSVETPFGKMKIDWEKYDNFLNINYAYVLSQRRIEPDQYPEFQNFLNAIQEKERKEVRIIRLQPDKTELKND
jgi:hypothetical protein